VCIGTIIQLEIKILINFNKIAVRFVTTED